MIQRHRSLLLVVTLLAFEPCAQTPPPTARAPVPAGSAVTSSADPSSADPSSADPSSADPSSADPSSTDLIGVAVPPPLGLGFHGLLPGSVDTTRSGTFRVEFRIYRSPQGGAPVWRETRDVRVTGGKMRIELGVVTPIPFTIHEATFKWLGASVDGHREVYPRYPIVNVVYASPEEARLAATTRPASATGTDTAATGVRLPDRTEPVATWAAALAKARAGGASLPTHEQWYTDLARCSPDAVNGRAGHYEWVLPWVYDSASHGQYNRYFRGRFQGCDYMDLSPTKSYPYRIAPRPTEAKGESR